MKPFLVALVVLALFGCAKVGKVVPYGPDTYIINADNAAGMRSKNYLQVRAIEKANAFCAQRGKVVSVQNATGAGAHMWSGTSANVIFTCVEDSAK